MRKHPLIFLTIILALNTLAASASRPGYIYDYGGYLDSYEETAINSLCEEVDAATTSEIVIVTLANLDEFNGDIDSARYTYFNSKPLDDIVGIGKEGEDKGVLIIVSYEESAWGIEVGYGLEGDLTDSEAGRIGRNIIVPYFSEGDYYTGLFIAAASVAEEIGYDVEDFEPTVSDEPDLIDILFNGDWGYFIFYLIGNFGTIGAVIGLIIMIVIGVSFLGRRTRGGRSGGGGASGRY